MKIMIFNTLYFPHQIGGAEVSVQLLAEELVKQQNEVCVVTLQENGEKKTTIINGVNVIYLPLKNTHWPFSNKRYSGIRKVFWHLRDYLNKEMYTSVLHEIDNFKPDVIHTNNISGFSVSVWDAVKAKGIKLVHTSRDYYLFHPSSTLFKNGKIMSTNNLAVHFWSYIKKRKSKYVDEYVAISEFVRDLHVSHNYFPNSNSHVVFNSVSQIETNKNNTDILRVGFIGRMTVEKGFDEYCELAKNNKNNKNLKFIAAGKFVSDSQQELERLAKESEVITCGYMDLVDFLNEVDVVVLPIKWNEPFGRTIVECALAGKIVLTTPVGSMPELGEIFDNVLVSDSIEESFKMISKKNLGVNISEDVSGIFRPETIARKYMEIYSSK